MKKYDCKQCSVEFSSYNKNPKFCSLKCKGGFQTTNINKDELTRLYNSGLSQIEIAKIISVTQKIIFNAMKRYGLKARVAFKRNQLGENNDSWKGDKAGYAAFHRRLYSKFGKPDICSVCGTKKSKNYDYANLTGKYEDIKDYAPMCRSCHWKYDNKILNIKHMRDKL